MAKRGPGRPKVETSRGRLPWRKFYPKDWLGDEQLGGCTPAAKGIWITALCLIWKHDNGQGSITATISSLARTMGCRRVELVELLDELAGAGVADVIYTRLDDGSVTNAPETVYNSEGNGQLALISNGFVTNVTAADALCVTILSRRISRESTGRDNTRMRVRKHRHLKSLLQNVLKNK